MALSPGTFEDCISFNRGDDRVIRYLKGETISLNEGEKPRKGWVLVCVDGFALGFAKGNGMNLKINIIRDGGGCDGTVET